MASQPEAPSRPWVPVAAAYVGLSVAAASISIVLTGFKYGVGNNIFHIPYVLRLAQTPEFSGDAFYGTLSNFTSIVWPLLRAICTESNVREVFRWADFASRAGAFAGMLFLFRSIGLKSLPAMTFCLAVAAVSPWLQGDSVVGEHGMFIDYFTQSEVTWAFVFLSIALLARDRLPQSFAMTGIAFAINAFVGIWLLAATSLTILATRKPLSIRTVVISIAAFALFAAPVAVWIATADDVPDATPKFSYIYYIRQYYPNHFLIESANAPSLMRLALLFANGLMAGMLAPNRRFWLTIQAALMLVFLVGVPLPYVLNSRFVFNLHLLRSAGIEQGISVALSVATAARCLFHLRDNRSQFLGLVIAFSLILTGYDVIGLLTILVALSILLAQTQDQGSPEGRWLGLIRRHAAPLTWGCLAVFVFDLVRQMMQWHFAVWQWVTLGVVAAAFVLMRLRYASIIAKQVTLALAFLCFASAIAARSIVWPAQGPYPGQIDSTVENRNWLKFVEEIRVSDIHGEFLVPIGEEFERFQLQARRVVWVGWKQGAAVMWSPSFYGQWMPRYEAVSKLNTPQDFIAYAQRNGIHNVALKADQGDCPAPSRASIVLTPYLLCQL
jgi:hypothetical protein